MWRDLVHSFSVERDLDKISAESISEHLEKATKIILDIIIYLIKKERALYPFQFDEFDDVLNKVDDWINKYLTINEVKNLRSNRLIKAENLSRYEEKILNMIPNISEY